MAFDYSKGERPEESYFGEFIAWHCWKCNAFDEDKTRPKKCPFCGNPDLNYDDIPHWNDVRPISPPGEKARERAFKRR